MFEHYEFNGLPRLELTCTAPSLRQLNVYQWSFSYECWPQGYEAARRMSQRRVVCVNYLALNTVDGVAIY